MYLLELGGEDDAFAAVEARSAADGVTVAAPGVATATDVRVERVPALAYTLAVSDLVGRSDATVDAARAVVEGADHEVPGPVAVRARSVRGTAAVSTAAVEREVGAALVDRGYAVDLDDPASVCRVAVGAEDCFVGWQVATREGGYGDRAPSTRPFVQPGGMDPLDARAVVNVAGAAPGRRFCDPMCGTGGLPIEAGLVGSEVVAADAQARMVAGTRENLRPHGVAFDVLRADATALPLGDDAVDAVAFDLPYGRQSKVVGDHLARDALAEAERVAPRGVVVADRDVSDAARAAGWRVAAVHERRAHRSLVRHVHVLR